MRRFRKQNKYNFRPNIGSLKTAIEEEWNKMPEEFILKGCKSFRRHTDTIIDPPPKKKTDCHIEWIYCFVSIFLFCSFFEIKINLVL